MAPHPSMHALVHAFYDDVWNRQDRSAAERILASDLVFRGWLGDEKRGRDAFWSYVRFVTDALSDYCCEVEEVVAEDAAAFAKVRFSGLHTGSFLGFAPSAKPVAWTGAARFRREGKVLADIWVLGDLLALTRTLEANEAARRAA